MYDLCKDHNLSSLRGDFKWNIESLPFPHLRIICTYGGKNNWYNYFYINNYNQWYNCIFIIITELWDQFM